MNNIVTLPMLNDLLSKATGHPVDVCERFVTAFTSVVSDALVTDGFVRIQGIGQFLSTNAAAPQVTFVPGKDMARAINAPFAVLEPEVLAPGVTAQMLGVEPGDKGNRDDGATPPIFYDFFLKPQ